MEKDDLVYLRHILDISEQILSKVTDFSREQFDADDNLRLALVHLIQTVGEAAGRISDEFQSRHANIPWHLIIGMRHRIVHDYLHVDYDIVWEVATMHIRPLRDQLMGILPAEEIQPPSTEQSDDGQEETG